MSRRVLFAAFVVALPSIGLAFFACGGDDSSPKTGTDASSEASEAAPSSEAGDDDGAADAPITSADPCGDRSGPQPNAAWPMAGGCRKRAGSASNAGPRSTMIRFRAPVSAGGTSPVIDTSGTVYVGTVDGRIVAIDLAGGISDAGAPPPVDAGGGEAGDAGDASDGGDLDAADDSSTTESADAAGPGATLTTLAVAMGGQLVYGDTSGYAYSLSVAPSLEWQRMIGAPIVSSPAITSTGDIVMTAKNGTAFGLALATGTVSWTATTNDALGTSAAAIGDDGTVFVGSSDKHVLAFTSDGKSKWKFATSDAVAATPVIGLDGSVIVGDLSGTLYAIDATAGTEKWHATLPSKVSYACAIGFDGAIFVSTQDGKVSAFEPTGATRWTYATNGATTAPIVDPNGIVYVGSEDAHVYAIAPSGKLRFAVSVFGPVRAQPAMGADGALYVTTDTEVVGVGP
jgi:outer membrane protein assembly factor BamB